MNNSWIGSSIKSYADNNNNNNKSEIKILPSILFYPLDWHGIQAINTHTKGEYPDSVMFQYGYSTNGLARLII